MLDPLYGMKKTVGTTALMLIAGPLSALVLAALLDVVLPLSSGLLPQPSSADMGPELPDSVLWLWVPGLFLLNAVIVVPISWVSFQSSRHPRVLCFGAVQIAALVVAAMLASDAPASGNRIQSFVGGFAVSSLAMYAMAVADMYILSRRWAHSV
jgi:hypothetical protein